jgi:predicted DNA-binding protein YlxM (UPF0122 family)
MDGKKVHFMMDIIINKSILERGYKSDSKYGKDLLAWLRKADSYSDFIQRVSETLLYIGFDAWAYARLDTPMEMEVSDLIGRNMTDMTKVYETENYAECDLAVRHIAQNNDAIFQSVFNNYVSVSPSKDDQTRQAIEMVNHMHALGYKDAYMMPLPSVTGGRYSFTVTIKNVSETAFQQRVNNYYLQLYIIAEMVDKVGCSKYPHIFLASKKAFDRLCKLKPTQLFRLVYEEELSVKAAGEKMGISQSTIDDHSKTFRKSMGAKSITRAIERAVAVGIFTKKTEKLRLEILNKGSARIVGC